MKQTKKESGKRKDRMKKKMKNMGNNYQQLFLILGLLKIDWQPDSHHR